MQVTLEQPVTLQKRQMPIPHASSENLDETNRVSGSRTALGRYVADESETKCG